MQANGAEMMRIACCSAVERGLELCAPIHDGFLITAPIDRIDDAVVSTTFDLIGLSAIRGLLLLLRARSLADLKLERTLTSSGIRIATWTSAAQ